MRRIRRFAAVVAAAGAVASAAQAATPAPVATAVGKWAKTALQIQDSAVLPSAKHLASVIGAAEGGCQSATPVRGPLAAVVTTFSQQLKTFVTNTERGEGKLYALGPKLGSKRAAQRKQYVALLDTAGTVLDHELAQARLVGTAAGLIGGGHCSEAVSDVDTAVSLLHLERNSLNGVIVTLRAQFG